MIRQVCLTLQLIFLRLRSCCLQGNMWALAHHGFTITDVKNVILRPVAGDYYKDPKQDFDSKRPGDIT